MPTPEHEINRVAEQLTSLAMEAERAAHCLSYNRSKNEAAAKRCLFAAGYALNSQAIRVRKERRGIRVFDANGNSRILSFRERLAYFILGNQRI